MKNSPDFWKTMGRVGITQSQIHKIPWEVVNEDQTISIDHNTVLKRWKTAFEQLLNPDSSAVVIIPEMMHGVYPVIDDTTTFFFGRKIFIEKSVKKNYNYLHKI